MYGIGEHLQAQRTRRTSGAGSAPPRTVIGLVRNGPGPCACEVIKNCVPRERAPLTWNCLVYHISMANLAHGVSWMRFLQVRAVLVTTSITMLHFEDLHIPENSLFALGAVCLGALVIRAFLPKSGSSLPLPPSPTSWRLQGHFLPSICQYLTVARWIETYGPVITIRSGIQNIVIIGRHKAAMDIMEKQGASLTDRPRMVAIGEILGGGLSVALLRAGNRLREMRRALHTHLQPKAAEGYQPLLALYAKQMVLNIFDDPPSFSNHIVTYAATTIMKIAYGKNTPTASTDPEVIGVRRTVASYRKIMRSGPYLVEWFPWLKYVPWYGQELKKGSEMFTQMNTNRLNRVRQEMRNENVGPSFAKHILENSHLYNLTELEMASLAGAFFGAGSDTVSAAIYTVVMAAALFPEEQAKVHTELDRVIGRNKAPTFADQKSLPCMQALISEALRWRPRAVNGLPHRTTENVIWENYCIPAGTTVIGNHWAISRDPEVFPQPHEFKPERWIDERGILRDDLKFFVYGFGRRVCPGQHVANKSVLITSLLILWAFQLTLDRTKPFDDMEVLNSDNRSCPIEFRPRVSEAEFRCIMEEYSEVL